MLERDFHTSWLDSHESRTAHTLMNGVWKHHIKNVFKTKASKAFILFLSYLMRLIFASL